MLTFETERNKKAVLSQGEPRDAAMNFDIHIEFTTASCGFPATARLSCWSLQTAVNHLSKNGSTRKNQSGVMGAPCMRYMAVNVRYLCDDKCQPGCCRTQQPKWVGKDLSPEQRRHQEAEVGGLSWRGHGESLAGSRSSGGQKPEAKKHNINFALRITLVNAYISPLLFLL